ncbi:TPA: hypothetical protein ACLA52_002099 [Neisseria meningitidis]
MLSLEIQQEGFTIGGGLVLGGCAGAHLARKEPLILTGKTGAGASSIGYQWTVNLSEPKEGAK